MKTYYITPEGVYEIENGKSRLISNDGREFKYMALSPSSSPVERASLVAQADPGTVRAIQDKIEKKEAEMWRDVVKGFLGEKI
jgi:hypothetical protein